MTELIIPSGRPDLGERNERTVDRMARRALFSLLQKISHGKLTLIENGQLQNLKYFCETKDNDTERYDKGNSKKLESLLKKFVQLVIHCQTIRENNK